MLNNFQNGATSSQLSPQAYRNSNQSGVFQQTYNSAGSGQSTSPVSVLSGASGSLQVSTGSGNNRVLGVSNTASTSPISSQTNNSNRFVPFALIFLVVSACLALYFFKRYKTTLIKIEEQSSDDED